DERRVGEDQTIAQRRIARLAVLDPHGVRVVGAHGVNNTTRVGESLSGAAALGRRGSTSRPRERRPPPRSRPGGAPQTPRSQRARGRSGRKESRAVWPARRKPILPRPDPPPRGRPCV